MQFAIEGCNRKGTTTKTVHDAMTHNLKREEFGVRRGSGTSESVEIQMSDQDSQFWFVRGYNGNAVIRAVRIGKSESIDKSIVPNLVVVVRMPDNTRSAPSVVLKSHHHP